MAHSTPLNPFWRQPRRGLIAAASLLACLPAYATNGYFAHGYGTKSEGIAGIGIALPQDALSGATNPATLSAVGSRLDVGAQVFKPVRRGEIVGNAFGPNEQFNGDGKSIFLIPNFGYSQVINPDTTVGVAVFGNGGQNTDFKNGNPYARFGATGRAGINLEQLFISPTLAYKVAPDHTLGVALNIGYQRFKATGLGFFSQLSSSPANVSDKGNDSSTGVGVRLGYYGKLNEALSVGATYQSKTKFGKFDKYKGLFPDQGSFDVPPSYGVGAAFKASKELTLAADVQRILHSKSPAIGNSNAALFQGVPLGAANGPSFGWRDITVVKLGGEYAVDPKLTLRAGISRAQQPIPNNQTFFNILAPGVVQTNVTLGATYAADKHNEFTFSYLHAPKKTVRGSNSIPPGNPPAGFGGGEANISLKEDAIGISWGRKF